MNNKELIKKEKIGEKYLLGINKEGQRVYLTEAKWDCKWYWGFGYISMPGCHTHWNSEIVGDKEEYDHKKKCFVQKYIHHLNDNKDFEATTLTDENLGYYLN